MAYEIHSSNNRIDATCLLILQAISVRWDSFYRTLINSTRELRDHIKGYSELTEEERAYVWDPKLIPSQKGGWKTVNLDEQSKRVLSNFKEDYELWNFIKDNNKTIFAIKEEDWRFYRCAVEAVAKPDFVLKLKVIRTIFGELLSHPAIPTNPSYLCALTINSIESAIISPC